MKAALTGKSKFFSWLKWSAGSKKFDAQEFLHQIS
jgi:hypothetical protein